MDKVRFGVVGLGNMGSGHTRNLFEGKSPARFLRQSAILSLTDLIGLAEFAVTAWRILPTPMR